MDEREKLRVSKIEAGTVIDHIPSGRALPVLNILGISRDTEVTVSILINARSGKFGKKDIVKVEGRKLEEEEINKIALTAPEASINIIEDFEVVEKREVQLPEEITGITKCANPTCITNASEPVTPKFEVASKSPIELRCKYCERITGEDKLLDQL